MKAYFRAISQNPQCFKDKVVLDIGCGTGVLAMFVARAGARRVYAVEASNMASAAKAVVEANGLGGVVEVIRGLTETVELPEKVDVIISEWMGNLLLKEAMLDTVLLARDRFLKPGGALYPSHATVYLAPCSHSCFRDRWQQYVDEHWTWQNFLHTMRTRYSLDYSSLTARHEAEASEQHLQSWDWATLNATHMHGAAAPFLRLDLLQVPLERVRQLHREVFNCSISMSTGGLVGGLCGFFDVEFRGSPESPTAEVVTLSTGPEANATHWGQQLFGFFPPEADVYDEQELGIPVEAGDVLHCGVRIGRPEKNPRLLRLELSIRHEAPDGWESTWREAWYV